MSDFSKWLIDLVKALFDAIWYFLGDVFIYIAEFVLLAVSKTISLIVLPCFASVTASGSALQGAFNSIASLSPIIMYFAQYLYLDQCFAMLSCAIIFVFVRKAVTLFQW